MDPRSGPVQQRTLIQSNDEQTLLARLRLRAAGRPSAQGNLPAINPISEPYESQQQVPVDPRLRHLRLFKFLIVDDEAVNLLALESMLNLLGVSQIKKVFNGQQALEMFKDNQFNFDVILTDFHMPEMDGVQFAREVRMLQHSGMAREATKIIVTSG